MFSIWQFYSYRSVSLAPSFVSISSLKVGKGGNKRKQQHLGLFGSSFFELSWSFCVKGRGGASHYDGMEWSSFLELVEWVSLSGHVNSFSFHELCVTVGSSPFPTNPQVQMHMGTNGRQAEGAQWVYSRGHTQRDPYTLLQMAAAECQAIYKEEAVTS